MTTLRLGHDDPSPHVSFLPSLPLSHLFICLGSIAPAVLASGGVSAVCARYELSPADACAYSTRTAATLLISRPAACLSRVELVSCLLLVCICVCVCAQAWQHSSACVCAFINKRDRLQDCTDGQKEKQKKEWHRGAEG